MLNSKLPAHQIVANEQFFTKVISSLQEGGVYGWPAELEIFTLRKGKLCGSANGLRCVSRIVSEDFFNKYFDKA